MADTITLPLTYGAFAIQCKTQNEKPINEKPIDDK
jgi:hypothetical protein